MPLYPLEFAKNKLLVTGHPSQMYVIIDWSTVKFISEPNSANIYKNYAFFMPEFDETLFPFIAICGKQHISILNINTLEHKPLISGSMPTGTPGIRFAFALGDLSELQIHFAFKILDKDGTGKKLIQYSYITLNKDAINWLTENGRLPSFTTEEYFEEIQMLKKYKEENQAQQDEIQALKEEI